MLACCLGSTAQSEGLGARRVAQTIRSGALDAFHGVPLILGLKNRALDYQAVAGENKETCHVRVRNPQSLRSRRDVP